MRVLFIERHCIQGGSESRASFAYVSDSFGAALHFLCYFMLGSVSLSPHIIGPHMSEQATHIERHTLDDQLSLEELNSLEGVVIEDEMIRFEKINDWLYLWEWQCVYYLSIVLVAAPLFGHSQHPALLYGFAFAGLLIGSLFALWNHQKEQCVIIDVPNKEIVKQTRFLGMHFQSHLGKVSSYAGVVLDEIVKDLNFDDEPSFGFQRRGIVSLVDKKGRVREVFRASHSPQALNSIMKILEERLGLAAFFGENGYYPVVTMDRYGALDVQYVLKRPFTSLFTWEKVLVVSIYIMIFILLANFRPV